ncbi:hypothetical protein AN958_04254 [Leucoagaricus sp. SymC.cos]|nr:hypothetical protein AN958_04254 [Leucoagaricus sp. SymC.cos]
MRDMGLSTSDIALIVVAGVLFIVSTVVFSLWRRRQRLASAKASAKHFTIDGSTVGAPTPIPPDHEEFSSSTPPSQSLESFCQISAQSTSLLVPSSPLPHTMKLVPLRPWSIAPHVLASEIPSASTGADVFQIYATSYGTSSPDPTPSTPRHSRIFLPPHSDSPILRPLPSVMLAPPSRQTSPLPAHTSIESSKSEVASQVDPLRNQHVHGKGQGLGEMSRHDSLTIVRPLPRTPCHNERIMPEVYHAI